MGPETDTLGTLRGTTVRERCGPDDKEEDTLTNPVEAGLTEGAVEDTGTNPVGAGFTEGVGEDTGTVIGAGVAGNANRGCDKKYNDTHTIMN